MVDIIDLVVGFEQKEAVAYHTFVQCKMSQIYLKKKWSEKFYFQMMTFKVIISTI